MYVILSTFCILKETLLNASLMCKWNSMDVVCLVAMLYRCAYMYISFTSMSVLSSMISQVQLLTQGGEVPRSLFQFDFDLERRIVAEAESPGQPSYSRIRADHSRLANGASASLAEVKL
jgi:hypothetical protein